MWFATLFVLALAGHLAQAQYIPVDHAENIENKEAWEARIVSGWEAQPGQHPHMVSLRMVNVFGTVYSCGGSVIHREWILTAAHCIASYVTIVIRAGVTHLTRPEIMLETKEYYIYPTFDVSNPMAVQTNDISLIKLPIPLQYTSNLRPIRMQTSSEAHRNYDEEIVIASGFGRTWTNGVQSDHLMWVYLRSISNEACLSLFGPSYVTDNTICARFFNVTSQSICQGDSGGPLVHVSAEGEPILVGISSFVAGDPFGCHSGLPGAFIRPGPFHGWFQEITGIDFNNFVEEDETTIVPTTIPTNPPTTLPPMTTTTELPETIPPSTTTTELPETFPPTTTTTTELPETFPPMTTTTELPTTFPPTTTTTELPQTIPPTTTTTKLPTTLLPTTTTKLPTTLLPTTTPIDTTTDSSTSTTAIAPPITPEEEVEEDEDGEDEDEEDEDVDIDDIDDPELADILKRLEVKIKVKVSLGKYLKKKKKGKKIIE